MPLLSVIIPVYNEERYLEQLVDRVGAVRLPESVEKEILIIDDASGDKSPEIIQRLCQKYPFIKAFRLPHNSGKGAAVRYGIEKMTGDYAVFQDADLEYDPSDYSDLLLPLLENRADVVYGSRFLKSSEKQVSLRHHKFGNQFLTFVSNRFTGLKLTDMETCYKMFRSDVLKSIPIRSNRFGIEPEVTVKIAKRQLRICEVPISFQGRSYAEGKKINWRDGFNAIWVLFLFRFWRDGQL
ncbi:glycosyl transferase [Planctomycetales bacterium]|nr:glycosyl transferase [Planctomycetales bacterium]